MRAQQGELFRFRFLTEVRFGVGIRRKISEFVAELGVNKIALVLDRDAGNSDTVKETVSTIKDYIETLVLSGPQGEPEISGLEIIREKARKFGAEAIIGLGGGSTLDMAKGLAAVLPNEKHSSEYQGFDKLEKPALPSMMIPTLFGSGAEVSASAVMINRAINKKGGINGRLVFPRMAVIDPELGLGVPRHIMGATALDALVHCIEGYVAKCATPLSRMYSRQAALMVVPALFKLSVDNSSLDALEDVAFASLLAITGLMHSESGVCGAISYPLGVHYGVPHGLSGGLAMPRAIIYNSENGCALYTDLINGTYNPEIAACKLSYNIRELITSFGLPSLSKFGVDESNIPRLAEEIFTFKGVLDMNPITIDSPMIIADLIHSAL